MAVVADGAGSARLGAVGANVAVEAASAVAWSQLSRSGSDPAEVIKDSVMFAREMVEHTAQWFGPTVQIGDLAATLLVAAVGDFGFCSAQVGDGAIVVETEAGLELLTPKRRSEYLNITEFLTASDLSGSIHCRASPTPPYAVCLMTDGVERLAILDADGSPVAGFFGPLLARMDNATLSSSQLRSFLRSDSVAQRTGDDVTLVLACRR